MRGDEDGFAVYVGESVKGVNRPLDKGFDDVIHFGFAFKEMLQLFIAVQAVGVECAYAGIGLGHHWVANLFDEPARVGKRFHYPAGSHGYASFNEFFLHFRFMTHRSNIMLPQAKDIEVVPQPGLGGQPEFI